MSLRKIVSALGLALVLCATWLSAQAPAGRGAGPATGQAQGGAARTEGRGPRPLPQRDLLYAAVPGRVNDIGFGGVGILVFDTNRNFRFVKRIPTWDYPASVEPENVKGIAASAPLNMIYVSKAFLAGLGSKTMSIADTKTNTVVQTVGEFSGNVRPFTINGAGTLIYANVNDLLGFQIGDVRTGKVIQTVQVQGFGWSRERLTGHGCPSHGIALSPDEKEIWLTDGANSMVHVFDNTVTPPKQLKSIKMRDEPFWLTWSANGKWVYSASGDIIDAQTKTVIAQLKDEVGRDVQGEKAVEIMFNPQGKATKAVDQFGVGQVRSATNN